MFQLVLLSVFLVSLFLWIFYRKQNKNFPPGPMALPIIGSMHSVGAAPHLGLMKLKKKYGPIIGLTMGTQKTICLHGAKLIREAFSEMSLSGRVLNELTSLIVGDELGILNASGDIWLEQRRFTLKALRDFGFGKATMEEILKEEFQEVTDWFRKQNGKPLAPSRRFGLSTINSLWRILTGQRFEHDDKQLEYILNTLESTSAAITSVENPIKMVVMFAYPKFAKMFPNWSGWAKMKDTIGPRLELIEKAIREHVETQVEGQPRDFIDVYLEEIKSTKDTTSSFYGNLGIRSLRSVMADFFQAGYETTSVSMTWLIIYMLNYPEIQTKLQDEIDRIIGRGRAPELKDRKNCVYTEAVIFESLRMSAAVTMGVPHLCLEDTVFHGYLIPKGCGVMSNQYDSLHDLEYWGDPEVFRPERFLSPDGKSNVRHEAFIPFGVGRRVCAGETLARDALFLFVTTLFQNFTAKTEPGKQPPIMESKTSNFGRFPVKFNVCMIERI